MSSEEGSSGGFQIPFVSDILKEGEKMKIPFVSDMIKEGEKIKIPIVSDLIKEGEQLKIPFISDRSSGPAGEEGHLVVAVFAGAAALVVVVAVLMISDEPVGLMPHCQGNSSLCALITVKQYCYCY
ncbi:hypothetical protein C5167_036356 [Papaver somniferum]|uniref:Uncharacterized protein n=1 Tax=Papaver somniferum TaxID=3469 RepID=A0A4Y7I3H2_PAPSO|nr:hypothetical protein C5167_036356 [Papaver somniferum]